MFSYFKEIVKFLKSVFGEFKYLKVPGKSETIGYLIIVLIITFFSSALFFFIDSVVMHFVNSIINWF